MARVVRSSSEGREFTDGVSEFEIDAATVRRLILELEKRFPGLGDYVERRMAIAIDGEIHQDSYGSLLQPDSEVFLIPKVGGG